MGGISEDHELARGIGKTEIWRSSPKNNRATAVCNPKMPRGAQGHTEMGPQENRH
jgi:hypothetical protein